MSTEPQLAPRPAVSRIESLDGLRGVAALVVVIFHTVMTQAEWAEAYRAGVPAGGAMWWATHTPLHLAWAGREAVLVFFVLSGLVLVLPSLGRPPHVPSWHARRAVRLLVPVWAAVSLSCAWLLLVPRHWPPTASWWLHAEGGHLSWGGVLRDTTLLIAPGDTLHPLWSLQWELIFCLALPALLHLEPVVRRRGGVSCALLLAILAGGVAADQIAAVAFACFGAGGLLAVHAATLRQAATRINTHRRGHLMWVAALCAAVAMLSAHWVAQTSSGPLLAPALTRSGQAVGAVALVVVVWLSPAAARAMSRPWALWTGDRSFSLYLVHYPIVMTLAVVGQGAPLPLLLAVALGTSISLAALFHRLVERPSHQLSRYAGHVVAAHTTPTGRPHPPAYATRMARGTAPVAVGALAALLLAAPLWRPGPQPDPIADIPAKEISHAPTAPALPQTTPAAAIHDHRRAHHAPA